MKIGGIGDSNLTENYVSGASNIVSLICSRFGATKVNAGYSGDTVAGMTARVPTDMLAHNLDVAFAMAGTNDAALAVDQYTPASIWIPKYLDDMSDLIEALSPVQHVIIASPPPARIARLCDEWPEAIAGLKSLCASEGVHYAPHYEAFQSTGIIRLNQTSVSPLMLADPDLYHTGSGGHALGADVIGDVIQSVLALPPAGCVWNSAIIDAALAYSNGHLSIKQASGTAGASGIATQGHSTGKWYFELTYTTPASLTSAFVGVSRSIYHPIINLATTGYGTYWYDSSGRINTGGSPAEGTGLTTWDGSGNTVGIALDLDNGTLDFIDKNGATITGFSGLPSGPYYPIAGLQSGVANGNVITGNFTGSFAHTPPGGFSAWA